VITKEEALDESIRTFYHATARNADGTAVRWRRNGRCKTWKRAPERFQVPLKCGLYYHGYLTAATARELLPYDPTDGAAAEAYIRRTAVRAAAAAAGMKPDTPPGILADYLVERGILSDEQAAPLRGLEKEHAT
jgi:hypothetical protein